MIKAPIAERRVDDSERFTRDGLMFPRDDIEDIVRGSVVRSKRAALLPDDFKAQKEGSGTRLIITDTDRILHKSGSARYVFRHANDVDAATVAGLDGARKRAEIVGDVIAPGGYQEPVTFFVSDPRYVSGYFFLTAVDKEGNETEEYLWTSQLDSAVLDTTIPGDVTHPQISENGEVINDTNYSVLFCKCQAPNPLGSFDRVQLFMQDFPLFGAMSAGHVHRYLGAAGGSIQFVVRYPPAVRRGTQTASFTNGSQFVTTTSANFLAIAKAQDVIEAYGVQGTIQAISADGNTITLNANWSGPTKVGASINDYFVIGRVRIHFVSISKGGTHRPDVENSPYVDVVMDGLMSAPNAPVITGMVIGNGIVIECEQLIGSQATVYHLWRAAGTGIDFTLTKHIDSIQANSNIATATDAPLQFRDSDFTAYEKENASFFTYYVTASNARGQHSAPSNGLSLSCRADNGGDVDPGVIGRVTHKNLLFDASLAGTQSAVVIATDTAQDEANGTDATNLPGRPYSTVGSLAGTGRFRGHTRWHSFADGGATEATHENFDEVHFPTPGLFPASCYLYQEVDAWDLGLGGTRGVKVTKNGVYVMSFYVKHDGVVSDGYFAFYLEAYNDGAFVEYFPRQYRNSSNDLVYLTTADAPVVLTGDAILSDWVRWFAVFQMDGSLGTTKQVRFTFRYFDATQGVVRMRRPMFHEGEAPSGWTLDMSDPSTTVPVPVDPPPLVGDRGRKRNGDLYYIEP